jgi:hypothetical protein
MVLTVIGITTRWVDVTTTPMFLQMVEGVEVEPGAAY